MIAGFHHAALAAVTQLPRKRDDGVIDVEARFIEDAPALAYSHDASAPAGGLSSAELARRMGFMGVNPFELEEPSDAFRNWGPREAPTILFESPQCAGVARPLDVIDVDAKCVDDVPALPAPAPAEGEA
jgi:hypothetical protein